MMPGMEPFGPGIPQPREGSPSEPPPPVPAAPYPPPSGGGRNRVALIVIGVALIAGAGVGIVLARGGGGGEVPDGWKAHDLTSDGFRLATPGSWRDLPPGDVTPALDEIRAENPELAELIEGQLTGSLSELVRFFAFDPDSPSLAQEFATNINVVVEPLPVDVSFSQYLQANLTQLRQVPGVSVEVRNEEATLPGGRAAVISSRFTLNSPSGPRQIDVLQYLFLKGRKGFILSMTTTPEHGATYATTFERIARSFQLV